MAGSDHGYTLTQGKVDLLMEPKAQVIQKMQKHIQGICDQIGPRPPGSDEERKAAEYIKAHWDQASATSCLEDFHCHPDAYGSTFRFPIALFIMSMCLYHLLPLLSFLCVALSVVIIVCSLILNLEIIDWMFPKRSSCNVHARFGPRDLQDRLVVISCHHDSNVAFPIANRFGSKFSLFIMTVVLSNALLLVICSLQLLLLSFASAGLLAGYAAVTFPGLILLTITIPVQLYVYLKVISVERPVMGANDNLSAVAVCLLLADHLALPENRPERTAVWLASFGSEEFGLRGSKRFIQRHKEHLQDAYVLNLDMVGARGTNLQVVTKEEQNLIALSEEMVALVQDSARAIDLPLKAKPIVFFTDAMSFAMKGIRATSLTALDKKGLTATYHSQEDTEDKLDYDIIFNSYRLCTEFLKRIDTGSRLPPDPDKAYAQQGNVTGTEGST